MYFKKQKLRTGTNSKRYEKEKNIIIHMVKCKSSRVKREKAFVEEVKTFKPKTTLYLPTLLKSNNGCKF